MRFVAASNANCASMPVLICCSISSRRCASSSSSTEDLMREASMARRHCKICGSSSGILASPELREHLVHLHPLRALFLERAAAIFPDGVVFALAAVLHLLPP